MNGRTQVESPSAAQAFSTALAGQKDPLDSKGLRSQVLTHSEVKPKAQW